MRFSKSKLFFFMLVIFLAIAFWMPNQNLQEIKYLERGNDQIKTEKVVGKKWLIWLYNNPFGRLSTAAIVKRKFVSEWYGKMMDDKESCKKIKPFIKDYNIDMSLFQNKDYQSFNDFFIRKIKPSARPIAKGDSIIVSPADGKLLVWQNIADKEFVVKGYQFDLATFLQNKDLAKKFAGGTMMIFRLCPTDYHRYHFPVAGEITQSKKIDGDYYSVSPIAIRKIIELFCLNKREWTLISTNQIGDVLMSEIGATMVGSIISTYSDSDVQKGEEKGFFKFGGSSVLLLFEKNAINVDEDLLINTQNGLETEVKMGERIAKAKN